jgi:methyl coenzyme M reductase beta subunit
MKGRLFIYLFIIIIILYFWDPLNRNASDHVLGVFGKGLGSIFSFNFFCYLIWGGGGGVCNMSEK